MDTRYRISICFALNEKNNRVITVEYRCCQECFCQNIITKCVDRKFITFLSINVCNLKTPLKWGTRDDFKIQFKIFTARMAGSINDQGNGHGEAPLQGL